VNAISAIHVRMQGYTAFFNHVFLRTAIQITLPTPTYSALLGLISACADKTVYPEDTRIGFEFRHASESEELERTNTRLKLDRKKQVLREVYEQGLMRRRIHFKPQLDLYLTNLDLAHAFTNPSAPPCLGRSQDLCWITKVEQVTLTPVKSGNIGSTMIDSRIIKKNIPSLIVRCAEWFDNEVTGRIRKVGDVGFYQAISPGFAHQQERINVTMPHLYHPSNLETPDDVIYLHQWNNN
jgi:CRISPR-associated Cas5-like protein